MNFEGGRLALDMEVHRMDGYTWAERCGIPDRTSRRFEVGDGFVEVFLDTERDGSVSFLSNCKKKPTGKIYSSRN